MTSAPGADVVVHVGTLKSSSWIGYPLAPNDRFLCAARLCAPHQGTEPSVRPTRYDCLCLRENDEDIPRWRFSQGGDVKGEPRRSAVIRVTGALSSNDGTVITEWALAEPGSSSAPSGTSRRCWRTASSSGYCPTGTCRPPRDGAAAVAHRPLRTATGVSRSRDAVSQPAAVARQRVSRATVHAILSIKQPLMPD